MEAIANAAAGYQRQFKPVRDVADRAGEVWISAEARIGAELVKLPKAKGNRGTLRGKGKGEGSSGVAIMAKPDETPSIIDIGLTHKRANLAQKLAAMPVADRNACIEQLKEAGKGVTPNAVLAASRQKTKTEKRHREFGWKEATALRFMRCNELGKSVNLTDLELPVSGLYLLAAPSTPDEARAEVIARPPHRLDQGHALHFRAADRVGDLALIRPQANRAGQRRDAFRQSDGGFDLNRITRCAAAGSATQARGCECRRGLPFMTDRNARATRRALSPSVALLS